MILLGRFIPIALALALAGSFAARDRTAATTAELPLHTPQFVVLLAGMIAFIGLPIFIPYLLTGPIAEALG
jgi:K+-transporting ATPase ATPase A chain